MRKANKPEIIRLITPEFRMSYPNLIEPRGFENKGNPSYSIEAIFNKSDMDKFKQLVDDKFVDVKLEDVLKKVAKQTWKGINVKTEIYDKGNWHIKNGNDIIKQRQSDDKKVIEEVYQDKKVVRFKCGAEYPPRLQYRKNREVINLLRENMDLRAIASRLFSAGNYAYAEIAVSATEVTGSKYTPCYLNSIMHTRNGDPIGGQSYMDKYNNLTGGEDYSDPTEGINDYPEDDDEIPF